MPDNVESTCDNSCGVKKKVDKEKLRNKKPSVFENTEYSWEPRRACAHLRPWACPGLCTCSEFMRNRPKFSPPVNLVSAQDLRDGRGKVVSCRCVEGAPQPAQNLFAKANKPMGVELFAGVSEKSKSNY